MYSRVLGVASRPVVARRLATATAPTSRPVVAVFSGQSSDLEAAALADVADVVHCPADTWSAVPNSVFEQADVALVWRMSTALDAPTLARFERLRSVVRVGVGYESVDLAAAADAGVAVSNTPAYGVEEVADTAMAHLLCLYRRTHQLALGVATGRIVSSLNSVVQREAVGATRIRGQRLGVVGLGRIGANVARKAQAFGFEVGFHDPHLADGAEQSHGGLTRHETLDELLAASDAISLHATYSASSHHLLSAASLPAARRGVRVVNTARGGLIDDGALASALESGAVGGAALDCQEAEPELGAESHSPYRRLLRDRPELNLLVTPHCAFYSDQSAVQMREMAAGEARRALGVGLGGGLGGGLDKLGGSAVVAALRNCVNAAQLCCAPSEVVCARWAHGSTVG